VDTEKVETNNIKCDNGKRGEKGRMKEGRKEQN
jgi:hypothetical protein